MGRPAGHKHAGEAAFEEISRAVPAFGGFFLENDQLVIYVTDRTKGAAAEAAVRKAARRFALNRVQARVGRYNFAQLREWRDQIEEQVLVLLPDAAWIDLDEASNQIAIGLTDGSGRSDLAEGLSRLGVPSAAVRIEVTGRDTPNQLLTERVRPIAGGLANAAKFNGQAQLVPWCTFAFNARYNGVDVILTSSHCTSQTYGVDATSTVFFQNSPTQPADQIGSEWQDPPAQNGNHRSSDAAMIRYDAGVTFQYGYLARTASRTTMWNFVGSRDIDAANPFRITAAESYPVANENVDKIGWKTGWTTGHVTATCMDSFGGDGFWRDCTYRASYYSGEGDSGAPVFAWSGTGNNVTIVGMHWGNNDTGQYSLFSPMGGLYQDFGSVAVEKPFLSVTISGPLVGAPHAPVTETAVVSNYIAPVSYQWTVNGQAACGNSSSCTATLGDQWTYTAFVVTVTDATTQSAQASRSVLAQLCHKNC